MNAKEDEREKRSEAGAMRGHFEMKQHAANALPMEFRCGYPTNLRSDCAIFIVETWSIDVRARCLSCSGGKPQGRVREDQRTSESKAELLLVPLPSKRLCISVPYTAPGFELRRL